MRDTPKNWKLVSRGFLRYVWQHGQRKYFQEGSGLKQDGWKWTSGIRLVMYFDYDANIFRVQMIRPGHPIVTVFTSMFVDVVMDWLRKEMDRLNRKYGEE